MFGGQPFLAAGAEPGRTLFVLVDLAQNLPTDGLRLFLREGDAVGKVQAFEDAARHLGHPLHLRHRDVALLAHLPDRPPHLEQHVAGHEQVGGVLRRRRLRAEESKILRE